MQAIDVDSTPADSRLSLAPSDTRTKSKRQMGSKQKRALELDEEFQNIEDADDNPDLFFVPETDAGRLGYFFIYESGVY